MIKIYLKTITAKQLQKVEIGDWIEGCGDILSLAQVKFIHEFRFLLAKLQDNPEWDATDAAHPAWWRGEEYGACQAARLITDVLSGKDVGKGAMHPIPGEMRDSVLALKKERDELKRQVEELIEERGMN